MLLDNLGNYEKPHLISLEESLTRLKGPSVNKIINLSKRSPTPDEEYLLALGKSFCPTLGESGLGLIREGQDRLGRTRRRILFFNKDENSILSDNP